MDSYYNTPEENVGVDGSVWFPSRTIKDIDGNVVKKRALSSYLWNNAIFALKGMFELVKVLAGSAVLIEVIRSLSVK